MLFSLCLTFDKLNKYFNFFPVEAINATDVPGNNANIIKNTLFNYKNVTNSCSVL